jgi:hypothetical protein
LEDTADKEPIVWVENVQSDNDALSAGVFEKLNAELAKKANLANTARDANFTLSVNIVSENRTYRMTATMVDIKDKADVARVVRNIDKSDSTIAGLIDLWKEKTWYIGARVGGALNFFDFRDDPEYNTGKAKTSFGFSGAAQVAIQPEGLKFNSESGVAFQLEVFYASSKLEWSENNGEDSQVINANIITPILLLRGTFRPGAFSISPFLGGGFNFSWGNYSWEEYSQGGDLTKGTHDISFEPFGVGIVGIAFGYKAGPGVVFLDARYIFDLGRTRPRDPSLGNSFLLYGKGYSDTVYRQHKVVLSVGYEFGL